MSRQQLASTAEYVVHYHLDESGHWIATVPAVPGCHTYGATLNDARRHIREALSLFVDDAAAAVLVDVVNESVERPRR